MKQKDQITEQINNLIKKSNIALNAGQNKQKIVSYLYIILSLTALSLFGLFAIGPTITTINVLNKEYDEGTIVLQQLQNKNKALNSLSSEYLSIKPELSLISSAIPESPNAALLTRQIEFLTVKDNLVVQKLNVGLLELYPALKTTTPIFSYSISIGVDGSEKDINAFIADLISIDRIIGIDRLSTGKLQGNLYTASIDGRAFYYKK